MSAYVVEDSTINKIVSAIELVNNHRSDIFPNTPLGLQCNIKDLAEAMSNMNVRAVNQRYSGKPEPNTFKYKSTSPAGRVQTYKALGCFLYQCSEGNVPNEWLYIALKEWESSLAHRIASSTEEYDSANWG